MMKMAACWLTSPRRWRAASYVAEPRRRWPERNVHDLYDALGLVRTQELLVADRYYGVDQYWASVIDYGFSKTREEALENGVTIACCPMSFAWYG